jgi:hypothetical protein
MKMDLFWPINGKRIVGRKQLQANDNATHCAQAPAAKRAFLGSFPLCLSRACLGKKMHSIYKWLKKWRFSHRGGHHNLAVRSVDCAKRIISLFWSFPDVCPKPVLLKGSFLV